ncbi:Protein YicC [Rubrivivax sp. A210]|uniref:YicC/YloC family endoribonuclease n=1 Tax=Rubrivivax sp. A210 TaxID=2772301 RepID=UPI001919C025|nr:YicC/YloC family endoribonuclease [Rubrivivax sp. A210]CAD5372353.1 Protein YicC [Rubrivivax sp. A210]
MTGYANAASELGGAATVTVEVRSVNGRFLDLALRLPDELRGLEPALRELLTAACKRGKIELRVATSREAEGGLQPPTDEQLDRLARAQAAVRRWLPQAGPISVNEALHWCRGGTSVEPMDAPALAAARKCIEGLREARAREGERLAAMLRERLALLRQLAQKAEPLVGAVVQRQQARFLERWDEALASAGGGPAEPGLRERAHERALAEAAAYAIRIDVAEELSRLASHLEEIERLLTAGGELGKRLEFLIQELQREANTLGSKSAALELTALSVEMKVAIEQMREQVQNIE